MKYDNVKFFLVLVAAIILIAALALTGFWLKRTVNYNMYYKAQVEQQVNKIIEQRISAECFIEGAK